MVKSCFKNCNLLLYSHGNFRKAGGDRDGLIGKEIAKPLHTRGVIGKHEDRGIGMIAPTSLGSSQKS